MILEQFRLDGKRALVTGGTKGLGRSISVAFAEAGADIAVVSRNPNLEIERFVLDLGRKYVHHAADLTLREEVKGVIPAVEAKMGGIDILVNNSGVIRRSPAAEYSEEDWDTTIEIDLTAAFILSQGAGQIMLKKGKGKIINVASVLAFQGGLNVVAYTVAKHGLVGLTRALANDWACRGINVNAIAPSFFITEMSEPIQKTPERSRSITARTPAGRWGTPQDIAGAALFLASAASDFVHGVVLPVDGGWMAW